MLNLCVYKQIKEEKFDTSCTEIFNQERGP